MSTRRYEVRVGGLVTTKELLQALPGLEVAEHEFRTVLSIGLADQGELYAFLALLRSYGLEVVEVRRGPGPGWEEDPA